MCDTCNMCEQVWGSFPGFWALVTGTEEAHPDTQRERNAEKPTEDAKGIVPLHKQPQESELCPDNIFHIFEIANWTTVVMLSRTFWKWFPKKLEGLMGSALDDIAGVSGPQSRTILLHLRLLACERQRHTSNMHIFMHMTPDDASMCVDMHQSEWRPQPACVFIMKVVKEERSVCSTTGGYLLCGQVCSAQWVLYHLCIFEVAVTAHFKGDSQIFPSASTQST